jgi:hypothetical protein
MRRQKRGGLMAAKKDFEHESRWASWIEDCVCFLSLYQSDFAHLARNDQFRRTVAVTGGALSLIGQHVGFRGTGGNVNPDEVFNRVSDQCSLIYGSMIFAPQPKPDCFGSVARVAELVGDEKKRIVLRLNATKPDLMHPVGSSDRLVRVTWADLLLDGRTAGDASFYMTHGLGKWWATAVRRNSENELFYKSCHFALATATGLVLVRRNTWEVEIGFGQGATMAVFTDPVGIKDLFRFREIEPGESRRAALRHWVRQHFRQLRHEPEVETMVREHLRGRTEFDWFGMQVKIHVPPSDEERRERAERERKLARLMGTDRRIRATD